MELDLSTKQPTDSISLRAYQKQCSDAVFDAWANDYATLIALFVGGGKTVIFSDVVRRIHPQKVMLLVHRDELIWQAKSKIEHIAKLSVLVDLAGERLTPEQIASADVIITTVQSQYSQTANGLSHMHRFSPMLFGAVIVDEAHRYLSPRWSDVIHYWRKNPDLRLLGVSVGPDSFVELLGGCFGSGFVGAIEEAFEIASKIQMPHRWFGFDVIDLAGVYSRGWTGATFAWKPCLRILRHVGKDCINVKTQGATVTLTPDHSIYGCVPSTTVRVTKGGTRTTARRPIIVCKPASNLSVGSLLVGDNGDHFDVVEDRPIDMLQFCELLMPNVSVVCDAKSVSRQVLKQFTDYKTAYQWRNNGFIPLKIYRQIMYPPKAISLRTEGSTCRIDPIIRLSDWAYILGFYLGDGWISDDRFGFAVGNSQRADIELRLRQMRGVAWASMTTRQMPGASVEIRANHAFLVRLFKSIFGSVRAWEKFIPGDWIISWPKEAREQLLRGLIDSDGCVQRSVGSRERTTVVTTSLKLANGVCSLVRSLGLWATIYTRKISNGGVVRGRQIIGRRPSYSVYWSNNRTSEFSHAGKRNKYVHDELKFTEVPVRSVSGGGRPQYVYDLEMFGHPSFVADGILVHNTATPRRHDGIAMRNVFPHCCFKMGIDRGVSEGWLVPPLVKSVKITGLNFDKVKLHGGDFVQDELAKIMEEEAVLQGIASATLQEAGDRKTIVFTVRVAQAEKLCEIFNRHKRGCAFYVCGTTPKDTRRNLLRRFKAGEFQIFCNVDIATEGWDMPEVSCIVNARPTLSAVKFEQMNGRGFRPWPGCVDDPALDTPEKRIAAIVASPKQNVLILDLAGNSSKHRLCTIADVLGGTETPKNILDRAAKILAKADNRVNAVLVLEQAKTEIAKEEREAELARKRAEEKRRERITAKATYAVRYIDPFSREQFGKYQSALSGKRGLNEKQWHYLKSRGHDPAQKTLWQNFQLIADIHKKEDAGPPTAKQISYARYLGIDPTGHTKKSLSRAIDDKKKQKA